MDHSTSPRRPDVVVVIATFNRAPLLGPTLDSLAATRTTLEWEAVVVDNNSTDDTRRVVEERIPRFPVPLRYLFEPRQGRSSALNAGIASTNAPVVAFTDDDVLVSPGWLESGCRPLIDRNDIQYTGGPVRPLWEAPCPPWLEMTRTDLWGTIAIQDHGSDVFMYEERHHVPLGANMAVKRSLFERIGVYRANLGRTSSRKILGQEVPELLSRARAGGARGLYVPGMEVQHHIPSARLTKQYFRRWWYGKGISRAALDHMQPVTELGLDLTKVPHVAGVPRFMWGDAARDLVAMVRAWFARDPGARTRHEMRLAYFGGYVAARRRT